MKIAPLQLELYFISDLHLTANKEFDQNRAAEVKHENLRVTVECAAARENNRLWQVTLGVKHQGTANANSPYSFSIEMVGFVRVLNVVPDDHIDLLVKTNGPSMIYGVVREVIRDLTARGPHVTVYLPSVSFYENPNGGATAEPSQAVAGVPAR